MAIGAMTAILLYVALMGGLLAGKVFPKLPLENKMNEYWLNTGLSIFWAIMAGSSLNILTRLVNFAEKSMGK